MSSKHYLQRTAQPRESRPPQRKNLTCLLKWDSEHNEYSGTLTFLISDGLATIGRLTLDLTVTLSGDINLSTGGCLKELPYSFESEIKRAMRLAEPTHKQLRLTQRREP